MRLWKRSGSQTRIRVQYRAPDFCEVGGGCAGADYGCPFCQRDPERPTLAQGDRMKADFMEDVKLDIDHNAIGEFDQSASTFDFLLQPTQRVHRSRSLLPIIGYSFTRIAPQWRSQVAVISELRTETYNEGQEYSTSTPTSTPGSDPGQHPMDHLVHQRLSRRSLKTTML